MVYFANITFGSIVVSCWQDRNLKHRCSTWSYQNIPPRSVSCIKQKHEDESDFLLDDQSEMSLSLAGLSVSRSGNCREPICTKCHVVTKMKYKFAKYRSVPISEKTAVLLSNLQSLQPIMNFFLDSVFVLFVSRLKLCEEDTALKTKKFRGAFYLNKPEIA